MTDTHRILIVDDSASDADFEIRALNAAGAEFSFQVVCTEPTFRAALEEFVPELILCDFAFPDFDGLSALRIVGEMAPATPLIFVSGTLSEDRAVIAMQNGAVDYVLKSNLRRLPSAVFRAMEQATERKGRIGAERRVAQLSRTKDVLSAVNSAIVRLRDKSALLQEACRIATADGGFAYAFVMTIAPDTGRVELEALIGPDKPPNDRMLEMLQLTVDNLDRAKGAVAESLRTLRPVALDVAEQASLSIRADLLAQGITAAASFPLTINGRAAGAMLFAAYESSHFDAEEMELLSSLTNNLAFALDLMEKQKRVDHLSYYDPLTELANRTLFTERVRTALSLARRNGDMTAVILLDVQRFANLNASLGQHAGDEILRQCAARLITEVGAVQAARFPGDRFAICLPALRDLQPIIELLAEDGVRMFREPFTVGGREVSLHVRLGCAVFPQDGADAETLSRNAEIALQDARHSDTPYQFYSKVLSQGLEARLDLEARLGRAVERSQFVLHYQPKVDVATRAIVGMEALIRWQDPERPEALVYPLEIIPVLERTGMIVDVGQWALHEAARQFVRWREAGLDAPRVAVNLSARQLLHPDIVEHVRGAVESCGGPCGIDLEITESVLMENLTDAAAKLREMRGLGVEIALDDFGTGYSSLGALHQLPISTIKIDRSFVGGMTEDVSKTSMISTIISLARSLRLKVVAEGVETEEEAHLLRLLQCDQMQGYLIARPAPAQTCEQMIVPA